MKKVLIVLIGLSILLTGTAGAFYRDYITYDCKYLAKGGNTDLCVVDVDGDGSKEIAAGFYNDGFGYLINRSGGEVWNIQTVVGVEATHAADIDDDGVVEIMFGAFRTLYVSDIEGNMLFKYVTQNSIRRISSGDLNNDGVNDVIFASQSIRTSDIVVLDADSKILFKKTVGGTHVPDFSIGDFDSDGISEIVVAAGKSINMYDADATTLWNYKVDGEATDLEVADIDGDGVADFVVGATSGVYVLNNRGELLWEFDAGGKVEAVKASDIDGDGKVEVVVGGFERVYLLDNKGGVLWSRDSVRQTNDVETGDLDLDGVEEVVAGSDVVNVFDAEGNKQWEYKPYMRVKQIRVADLDSDGINELLVGALDNSLYIFKPREIYINEQKTHILYSEAEKLCTEGSYEAALKCIEEAIDIRNIYSVGECQENPSECDALLEKIQGEITPPTTTIISTTTTTVSSTTLVTTASTSSTTPPETGGLVDLMSIAAVLLVVVIVGAAAIYLKKGR